MESTEMGPPRWLNPVGAVVLVALSIYLGAISYHPAESGVIPGRSGSLLDSRPKDPQPWSKGVYVDPKLASAAAGCFAVAVVLFRKT